jgi:hypothetical protein
MGGVELVLGFAYAQTLSHVVVRGFMATADLAGGDWA